MTEKEDAHKHVDPTKTFEEPEFKPTLPKRQVVLSVDAKESDHHRCGEHRVRTVFAGQKVSREIVTALTQRCYVLRAGGKTKLKISFLENNEKASPKGTLLLETSRGKVSPSRIELDGKHHEVTVEYTAPDETVRVSVRAFIAGFTRAKAHLHLEA